MNQSRREAHYGGQHGIKRGKLQFLEEQSDRRQIDQQQNSRCVNRFCADIHTAYDHAIKGSERQFPQKHGIGIQMHRPGIAGDQDDGDGKEQREHDPDRGVLGQQPGAAEQLRQPYGHDAHQRRAQNQKR